MKSAWFIQQLTHQVIVNIYAVTIMQQIFLFKDAWEFTRLIFTIIHYIHVLST